MRSILTLGVLVSTLFLGFTNPASAQLEFGKLTGKVAEVQEKAIRMVTQEGKVVLVHLDPNVIIGGVKFQGAPTPEIQVTGRLSPTVLKNVTLPVKIVAELDERGNAVGKVAEIKVFSPSEKDPFGVKPANPGLPMAEEKGKVTPGLYVVAGPVARYSRNTLSLSLSKSWKCDLAENVQVNLDATDHRFVTPGDGIVVEANYHDETEVWGATVKVVKPTPADVLEADKIAAAKPAPEDEQAMNPADPEKDPMEEMPAEPAPAPEGAGKRDKPGRILKIN